MLKYQKFYQEKKMKKIISLIIAFLFCFESFLFANYEGYKSYLKGLLALKKGKADVAVSEFERTLSYDSNATTVYKDLALVHMQQGNINTALESAKKLQELEGDNVKTQMFLGAFYLSINEIADRYLNFSGTAPAPAESGEEKSFAEILSEKRTVLKAASGLNFSKHAAERLSDRNIVMSPEQLERLGEGVDKASDKGINDSLVMVDTLAFIVNTKSRTVVTAIDSKDTTKDSVFSNIDGAVIA